MPPTTDLPTNSNISTDNNLSPLYYCLICGGPFRLDFTPTNLNCKDNDDRKFDGKADWKTYGNGTAVYKSNSFAEIDFIETNIKGRNHEQNGKFEDKLLSSNENSKILKNLDEDTKVSSENLNQSNCNPSVDISDNDTLMYIHSNPMCMKCLEKALLSCTQVVDTLFDEIQIYEQSGTFSDISHLKLDTQNETASKNITFQYSNDPYFNSLTSKFDIYRNNLTQSSSQSKPSFSNLIQTKSLSNENIIEMNHHPLEDSNLYDKNREFQSSDFIHNSWISKPNTTKTVGENSIDNLEPLKKKSSIEVEQLETKSNPYINISTRKQLNSENFHNSNQNPSSYFGLDALDCIDIKNWILFSQQTQEMINSEEEISATQNCIKYLSSQINRLSKVRIIQDTFKINLKGSIASINGFRLGRHTGLSATELDSLEPSIAPTDDNTSTCNNKRITNTPIQWDEVNVAWGQTCLLLEVLIKHLGLNLKTYKLIPGGSNSTILHIPDNTKYHLFNNEQMIIPFLSTRRFDQAMAVFLYAMKEALELIKPCTISTNNITVEYPHKIEGENIGGLPIRLQFNQIYKWNSALKLVLHNLKWLTELVESIS